MGKGATPKYAVRLLILFIAAGVIFFGGLQLFVPEGSKLTGSYDAKSLRYIASAPLSYSNPKTCGTDSCHSEVYKVWSEGAHGAKDEKSKCEVCHGPQGDHPDKQAKLVKVRGDGNLVELCLSCHRKLKARSTTGQPQIVPKDHPYPHEGELNCLQCHNPHSPGLKKVKSDSSTAGNTSKADAQEDQTASAEPAIATKANCSGCHGPAGRGGFAPQLGGLASSAIKEKLNGFRSGALKGNMMNTIAANLSDNDIDVLAQYYSTH